VIRCFLDLPQEFDTKSSKEKNGEHTSAHNVDERIRLTAQKPEMPQRIGLHINAIGSRETGRLARTIPN
jgi:hypothetical protein